MSNFSDREDRDLVQRVKDVEDRGGQVSWVAMARAMAYSKKTNEQLRARMKTLRTTHGKNLSAFPKRFFMKLSSTTKKKPACRPSRPLHPKLIDKPGASAQPIPIRRQRAPRSSGDHRSAQEVVKALFAKIPVSVVRQKAACMSTNVGEITEDGVAELIRACALTCHDVFVDIGSGVGNVIAQVALEADVRQAIGVELQNQVGEAGELQIREAEREFQALRRVRVIVGDIRSLELVAIQSSTVIFSDNTVFDETSNLAYTSGASGAADHENGTLSEVNRSLREHYVNTTSRHGTLHDL